ncbi:BRISC complex subunit Abraxas 2-like [Varroa jacobsoni]|uniref:Uncharacterized protein n=1 Tax=Varroa destructor TaxID=109461 RepID=A0A7M7K6T8_VARDE|nr:BRISC complex subunit Abraxas 2-like [Varroa destructor]XP_022685832.1 BRISC complex subunit Abraxas 2-like [Varroa jacobsoni]
MSVQVSISGPVFAQLLRQHAVSPNNQEGLLFGEISERRVNQINDQAAVNEHNEVTLKVCSFIKFEPFEIYDQNLKLLPDPLREMEAGLNGAKVIGYYCFRRNLPLTATYREHVISNALAKASCGQPFVLGLFSTTFNDNYSIHSMDHSFHIVTPQNDGGSRLGAASLRVVNLGEDARQEYRTQPGSAASLERGFFSDLAKSIPYNGREDRNVQLLNQLHNNLQKKLNALAREITETLQLHEETTQSYEQRHQ